MILYRKPPSGPIRSMSLSPTLTYSGNWTLLWDAFNWTGPGGFKTQIDLIKSIGCNGIRVTTDVGHGIWTGTSTKSQLFSRIAQVVAYCLSNGMWYLGSLQWPVRIFGGNAPYSNIPPYADFNNTSTIIASYSAEYCRLLAGFPNVWGCDLANEFFLQNLNGWFAHWNNGSNLTTTQMQTLTNLCIANIRQVAPKMAISGSMTPFDDPNLQFFASSYDFLDCHAYGGNASDIYNIPGTDQKQIFIGEVGYALSTFPRTYQLHATYNNYVNFPYPSGQPGCIGWNLFCTVPYDSISSDDFGVWDSSGVDRGDLATYYAAYPVQTPLFLFPRTGWGM